MMSGVCSAYYADVTYVFNNNTNYIHNTILLIYNCAYLVPMRNGTQDDIPTKTHAVGSQYLIRYRHETEDNSDSKWPDVHNGDNITYHMVHAVLNVL